MLFFPLRPSVSDSDDLASDFRGLFMGGAQRDDAAMKVIPKLACTSCGLVCADDQSARTTSRLVIEHCRMDGTLSQIRPPLPAPSREDPGQQHHDYFVDRPIIRGQS